MRLTLHNGVWLGAVGLFISGGGLLTTPAISSAGIWLGYAAIAFGILLLVWGIKWEGRHWWEGFSRGGADVERLGGRSGPISDMLGRALNGLPVKENAVRPRPDMPMHDLAERIYASKGPLPPVGIERRRYLDEVSNEIMRGIIFNGLHLWAAEGEYRFEPIPPSVLKRAQLLHESSSLNYLPAPDGARKRWLTNLELNRAEVDKAWPKETQ